MPTIAELPAVMVTLDATHRCDACQAQAYVSVDTSYGTTFELCGHHYVMHAHKLEPVTLSVTDERWRLDEVSKLDVSA